MFKKLMLATIASLVLVGGSPAEASNDTLLFSVDVSGSLYLPLTSQENDISGNYPSIWFSGKDVDLSNFFLDYDYTSGANGTSCFPGGTISASLMVYETRKGHDAEVNFFIKGAFLDDGTPIDYLLTITDLDGWNDCGLVPGSAEFPPIGGSICMLATKWVMKTGQKGKIKNACTGSGEFTSSSDQVLIMLTQPTN